jgi:hypothetical protein
VTAAELQDNLGAFLREVIPVAQETGVRLPLHPIADLLQSAFVMHPRADVQTSIAPLHLQHRVVGEGEGFPARAAGAVLPPVDELLTLARVRSADGGFSHRYPGVATRPERANHVWSYDFVKAMTHDGRALRILVLIDEYTRECLEAVKE